MKFSDFYKPGLDSLYILYFLRYFEGIICFITAFYLMFIPIEFAKGVNPHLDEQKFLENEDYMQVLTFICGLFGNATLGYGLMKLLMLMPNKGHPYYEGKLMFCKIEMVTKIISPCFIIRNMLINLNSPKFSPTENIVELAGLAFTSFQFFCMSLSLYYEGQKPKVE